MTTPIVILVRPQMGENIGAAARAMANFGLLELRLVAPRDGWPNKKALDMATHGAHLIKGAKLFDDLPSALADLSWVAASSARPRDMPKPMLNPESMAEHFQTKQAEGQKVGLMFGPEASGLTNEDLMLADVVVTIPTAPAASSLNIAQAVVVLAHACFALAQKNQIWDAMPGHIPATKEALQLFFTHLEARLDEAEHWRTDEKKERMWLNMRNLFTRAAPDAQELQSLFGVIRSLKDY